MPVEAQLVDHPVDALGALDGHLVHELHVAGEVLDVEQVFDNLLGVVGELGDRPAHLVGAPVAAEVAEGVGAVLGGAADLEVALDEGHLVAGVAEPDGAEAAAAARADDDDLELLVPRGRDGLGRDGLLQGLELGLLLGGSGSADSLARAAGTASPARALPAASSPPLASAAVVRNCRLLTSAAIPSSDRSGLVGTRGPGVSGMWGAEPTGRRGVRGAWAPCEHGTARAPASRWAIWVEPAGLAPGWRGLCRRGVWAALPDIGPLRLGAPYSSRSLPTPRPMPWPCPPP